MCAGPFFRRAFQVYDSLDRYCPVDPIHTLLSRCADWSSMLLAWPTVLATTRKRVRHFPFLAA